MLLCRKVCCKVVCIHMYNHSTSTIFSGEQYVYKSMIRYIHVLNWFVYTHYSCIETIHIYLCIDTHVLRQCDLWSSFTVGDIFKQVQWIIQTGCIMSLHHIQAALACCQFIQMWSLSICHSMTVWQNSWNLLV